MIGSFIFLLKNFMKENEVSSLLRKYKLVNLMNTGKSAQVKKTLRRN